MLVHIHSSWAFGGTTKSNTDTYTYGHQMLLTKNVTVLWERRPMVGRNVWVGVPSSTLQFLLSDIFGRHNLKRITSWSRLPFSGKSSQLEPVTWQALWDLNSPVHPPFPLLDGIGCRSSVGRGEGDRGQRSGANYSREIRKVLRNIGTLSEITDDIIKWYISRDSEPTTTNLTGTPPIWESAHITNEMHTRRGHWLINYTNLRPRKSTSAHTHIHTHTPQSSV